MRTLLCLLLILGQPGLVRANSAEDQLRTFANCAGRLTAQLEHQWLWQTDQADATRRQRQQLVGLLESVIPTGRGRDVLIWRTDARAAQRALLNRAAFGSDPQDQAWAARTARTYLAACTDLLLS